MSHINNRFVAASLFEARSATPLTEDELRNLAPSIFAPHEHESCSPKFKFWSTWDAINALQDRGFVPVSARQGRSRTEGKEFFTKHLIRFRRDDMIEARAKDTETGFVPEVLLMNAHDRTSSWRVMSGGFRPICKNGLVTADRLSEERIGHGASGKYLQDVIDATFRVVDHAMQITDQTVRWREAKLNTKQRLALAHYAHDLRLGRRPQASAEAIAASDFLAPRREQDRSADLWTVFNCVQENAMMGGQHGLRTVHTEDGEEKTRVVTVRALNAIDAEVDVNRKLWGAAASLFEHGEIIDA